MDTNELIAYIQRNGHLMQRKSLLTIAKEKTSELLNMQHMVRKLTQQENRLLEFSPKTWEKLSANEKQELLEFVVSEESKALHLKNEIAIEQENNDYCEGRFHNHTIYVNTSPDAVYIPGPIVYETIVHEMRHAYQRECMEGLHEVQKEYSESLLAQKIPVTDANKNPSLLYLKPHKNVPYSYGVYCLQPVEYDASKYAHEKLIELKELMTGKIPEENMDALNRYLRDESPDMNLKICNHFFKTTNFAKELNTEIVNIFTGKEESVSISVKQVVSDILVAQGFCLNTPEKEEATIELQDGKTITTTELSDRILSGNPPEIKQEFSECQENSLER